MKLLLFALLLIFLAPLALSWARSRGKSRCDGVGSDGGSSGASDTGKGGDCGGSDGGSGGDGGGGGD